MSRFMKSRSAWDLVAAVLLVLTTAELTSCRPRRHESAETEEVNRLFWDAFADEGDRRAAREQGATPEVEARWAATLTPSAMRASLVRFPDGTRAPGFSSYIADHP
ncbi:MAG: hypothetical protein JWM10_1080 [Myxococcaceae bacterium]|nr:hypothetical protein [Myxococcaceae bacterium]